MLALYIGVIYPPDLAASLEAGRGRRSAGGLKQELWMGLACSHSARAGGPL